MLRFYWYVRTTVFHNNFESNDGQPGRKVRMEHIDALSHLQVEIAEWLALMARVSTSNIPYNVDPAYRNTDLVPQYYMASLMFLNECV